MPVMDAHNTVFEITRRVVQEAAPSEERLLDVPNFPNIGQSEGTNTPFGIGLEPEYIFIAPLVYVFFDSLVKELGKDTAGEIKSALKKAVTAKKLTRNSIENFLRTRGLQDDKASEIAEIVLNEIKS